MKRKRVHEFRMVECVAEFGTKNVDTFPATTIAGQLVDDIGISVKQLSEHSALQVTGQSSVRASSLERQEARKALRRKLRSMSKIARLLDMKGFWLPSSTSEARLIATARSFALAAEPMQTVFIQHGLPPAFIENLNAGIEAVQGSVQGKSDGRAAGAGAVAEFDKKLDAALKLVDRFGAIVENSMADNAAVMAAWQVARQVETVPTRHKEKPAAEPKPTVTPTVEEAVAATATA